jgi:hypothetical protein
MTYLLLGLLLFAFLYRAPARRLLQRHANWRSAVAVLAVGLFAAAGFVALRGGWDKAIVLIVIGAALTGSARWPRSVRPAAGLQMSLGEARATLGVGPEATREEIKAAYARLIQKVHPDRGGAPGLAAHLNVARDVLLRG